MLRSAEEETQAVEILSKEARSVLSKCHECFNPYCFRMYHMTEAYRILRRSLRMHDCHEAACTWPYDMKYICEYAFKIHSHFSVAKLCQISTASTSDAHADWARQCTENGIELLRSITYQAGQRLQRERIQWRPSSSRCDPWRCPQPMCIDRTMGPARLRTLQHLHTNFFKHSPHIPSQQKCFSITVAVQCSAMSGILIINKTNYTVGHDSHSKCWSTEQAFQALDS